MRQELLLKSLVGLGLKEVEAEIYLLLSKEGPQTGKNIAEALSLYKQQLYRSLKSLQYKGCVKTTRKRPARFSAAAIEEVIDLLVDMNLEEAQDMERNRQRILAYWQAMIKKDTAR